MTDRPCDDANHASPGLTALVARVQACVACAEDFAATATAHAPRPVLRPSSTARVLLAGQAPGRRVHLSGTPFDDPSGERLRDWMGVDRTTFYDEARIAILPMAFCFPGYDSKGSDLPPPKRCAALWRTALMAAHPQVELILLIGGYAARWHLGAAWRGALTPTVAAWREILAECGAPARMPLPHPSWRNTAWLKRHPWFETETVPELRRRLHALL